MKKSLIAILILLCSLAPASAQRSIEGLSSRSVFKVLTETKTGFDIGTGFCVPGRSGYIFTASHVLGATGDLAFVKDQIGNVFEFRVVTKDDKTDVAVLNAPGTCELNPLEFAKDSGHVGDEAWLFGWGAGLDQFLLTKGIISSRPGVIQKFPQMKAAQLGAMFGHSGGPVFDRTHKVIGMMSQGLELGGYMNFIVPVEVLRKAVK